MHDAQLRSTFELFYIASTNRLTLGGLTDEPTKKLSERTDGLAVIVYRALEYK